MSRNRRYRGRHQNRRWTKVLLTVFLVLLVLGSVVYFYIQNHLVYGPDGSVSVNLPWLDSWRTEESPSPSPIQIITDSPPPVEPSVTPSDIPASPTPAPLAARHALYLPLAALSDQAALDSLLQVGADTKVDVFVLECKADDGRLAWVSASPLAQGAGLNAAADLLGPAIQKIHNAGFSVTARISCFRDKNMPDKRQAIGIKHNVGLNWLEDSAGKQRWLNPYQDEAVSYLCALISELAAMPFDEILLDNVQFPTQGSISYIDYGAAGQTPRHTPIESFIAQAKTIVDPSDIELSAMILPETATLGQSVEGGQRLTVFSGTFDRLYAAVDAETFESVRSGLAPALGSADLGARFVPVFAVPNNAGTALLETTVGLTDGSWMLLNETGQYATLWP